MQHFSSFLCVLDFMSLTHSSTLMGIYICVCVLFLQRLQAQKPKKCEKQTALPLMSVTWPDYVFLEIRSLYIFFFNHNLYTVCEVDI